MKTLASPLVVLILTLPVLGQSPLDAVLKSERERVQVIEKIKPTAVAVFTADASNGGSGVLISEDGYALSNFHVTDATGPTMRCGLADGHLYDAVLVGLDKVGDVALIKLLPKKAGDKFPFAPMGNSDLVQEGDWSIAMGNPFLLATNFHPTVSFGLISGIHRYQYPAGTLLEYTDCIQIDTVINPGNSGGPLYNMKGEVIGINGRGSFDKRGRINSGVGYAISINQIKNFLGHLKAGLDSDHASLAAVVTTQTDQTGFPRMEVTQMLEDSDVARRGLEIGDELFSFAGRPITSVNQFKNVAGLYPRGWRVPLEYRREQTRKEILVRLSGVQRKVLEDNTQPKGPQKLLPLNKKTPQGPAAKFYIEKPGFANYYFNKQEKDRLLQAFQKHGSFADVAGAWSFEGHVRLKALRADINQSKAKIDIAEEKAGEGVRPTVQLSIDSFPFKLEPLELQKDPQLLKLPEGSGGLLSAMYLYHQLLTQGEKGFKEVLHGGMEPWYPPADDPKTPAIQRKVDCEVLNTVLGPYLAKWFFAKSDARLVGLEVRLQDNEDPCEVYFSDYKAVNGRQLPHRMQVLYGNGHYGAFSFTNIQMATRK